MMKFLAILVALGIEQWRIASWRRASESVYVGFLHKLELYFSPDRNTWLITAAALSPVLGVLLIDLAIYRSWWLSLAWSILLLYFLMGFRHFSHAISEITADLVEGDLAGARQVLHNWQGGDTFNLTSVEIAQRTIEGGIISAYRHVFGIFFWFCILGGAGAALYWMLNIVSREWAAPVLGSNLTHFSTTRGTLGKAARWLLFLMDWIPIRVLAFTFAVVGNFEDGIYQWRALPDEYALFDNASNENVLLATAMGALGVNWNPGMRAVPSETSGQEDNEAASEFGVVGEFEAGSANTLNALYENTEPEPHDDSGNGLGAPPVGVPISPGVLPSAIGMTWRALVFWLMFVAVLAVAGWWHS